MPRCPAFYVDPYVSALFPKTNVYWNSPRVFKNLPWVQIILICFLANWDIFSLVDEVT